MKIHTLKTLHLYILYSYVPTAPSLKHDKRENKQGLQEARTRAPGGGPPQTFLVHTVNTVWERRQPHRFALSLFSLQQPQLVFKKKRHAHLTILLLFSSLNTN